MATKNEPLKNNQKGPLSFDDLSASDLIRGTTPVDIKARCLTVCRSYLAASWLSATEEDIEVTRITGGLTNQIYRVKLLKTDESVKRELCTDVAIKFYLPKLVANFDAEDGERLNDTIILTILSELGIHPRVFGIFKDGFVQEYVEHHQFGPEHQKQPELLRIVAHLMAKVHSLQVPIRKNLDALTSAMGRHIDEAYEDGRMELIKELNLK
ncbi:PREDICTED: choline/ethanolamine kinase-like, partial [Rhagoletis zephyria]|uniref:choline/ethanolamine kinase-like n=1 Tax=Rhagoletis zephyria TaxID=28612 RepID=UPI0008114782